MDAEHRHELKQNDLVAWIANFPAYARENTSQIIGVVLIALGLISWLLWPSVKGSADNSKFEKQSHVTAVMEQVSGGRVSAISSGEAATDSLLFAASSLEAEAGRVKDPVAKSLVLIKRGEALRSDLHYRGGIQDAAVVASQIQEAKAAYDAAILSASGQPGGETFVGMATYGLGLCAEEVGDFVKAEAIYKSIIANAELEGTVFPTQAKKRIATLADNKGEIVFTKAVVEAVEVPVVIEPAVEVEAE